MRIRPLSLKNLLVGGTVLYGILGLVLAVVFRLAGLGPASFVALPAMLVLGVLSQLRVVNRTFVEMSDPIAWRTFAGKRGPKWATPSGSVPVAAVSAVVVVPQDSMPFKTVIRGCAVRLQLADGTAVTLPIFTQMQTINPAFRQLITALRGTLPPAVPVDTTALGTADLIPQA